MMRKTLVFAVVVAASVTLVTGCGGGNDPAEPEAQAPPASTSPSPSTPSASSSAPSPSSSAPSAEATPSGSPSASPSATATTPAPPPEPKKLKIGAKGAEVLALQKRLTELGYWNGKADSKFGGTTQQAVFALQKAAGISRDGTVGPKTRKALDAGVRPKAKSTSGYLVEINLKKQLMMFVKNGEVVATLNTSTGSNENYEYEGNTYLADTPSGRFKVGRQIDGMRNGPLGQLWRPKYFNGGIAVHGAPSVPPYPASHGCARVSNAAMNWIWSTDKIPLKTKVWVYRA